MAVKGTVNPKGKIDARYLYSNTTCGAHFSFYSGVCLHIIPHHNRITSHSTFHFGKFETHHIIIYCLNETTTARYSAAKWTPMRIKSPEIFFQECSRVTKIKHKTLHYWSFVNGIIGYSFTAMKKALPYHYIVMRKTDWYIARFKEAKIHFADDFRRNYSLVRCN